MSTGSRQVLRNRHQLCDGLAVVGAGIFLVSVLFWHWHAHIAIMGVGLLAMVVGATQRLGLRCPKCGYILGRPGHFCGNCGTSLDPPG